MTTEATPAASLTSVRVRRRKQPRTPSGKPGDLTADELAALVAEPLLPREPAGVILLPAQLHEPEASPAEPAIAPPDMQELQESLTELVEAEPLDLSLLTYTEEQVADEPPEPEPAILLPMPPALRLEAYAPRADSETETAEAELAGAETAEAEAADAEAADAEAEDAEAEDAEAEDAGEAFEAAGEDILDYWDSLRGGRDFPPLDDLDRTHVAATWPNTLLLAVESTDLPRITRLGATNGEIDYTATVIDWIMSRAKQSAKRAEPMEEERRFAVSTGGARYRILLLPLSSYGLSCDHVLCQLSQLPELGAVASIKRWFAS